MTNNWFIKKDADIEFVENIIGESSDSSPVFTNDKITIVYRHTVENQKITKTEIKVKNES